jgi:hypothetical protein
MKTWWSSGRDAPPCSLWDFLILLLAHIPSPTTTQDYYGSINSHWKSHCISLYAHFCLNGRVVFSYDLNPLMGPRRLIDFHFSQFYLVSRTEWWYSNSLHVRVDTINQLVLYEIHSRFLDFLFPWEYLLILTRSGPKHLLGERGPSRAFLIQKSPECTAGFSHSIFKKLSEFSGEWGL